MKLDFTKMHGCGNDYVYIDCIKDLYDIPDRSVLSQKISDRHFGVGSDGLIFINPSKKADFEMEMYNADGSRAQMCGNGIRCVAKYVYDHGYTDKTEFTIESYGSIKQISVFAENGCAKTVTVDMGEPILTASDIPVISVGETVISGPIYIDGQPYKMTCVSMGNPHAVIFTDLPDSNGFDLSSFEIEKIGPLFENHVRFPQRTNTEFVRVIDRSHIEMRVWERGAGETLCCGTGCCASVVACVLNDRTDTEVNVSVTGGELSIKWDRKSNHIFMTGPAETVFTGTYDYRE